MPCILICLKRLWIEQGLTVIIMLNKYIIVSLLKFTPNSMIPRRHTWALRALKCVCQVVQFEIRILLSTYRWSSREAWLQVTAQYHTEHGKYWDTDYFDNIKLVKRLIRATYTGRNLRFRWEALKKPNIHKSAGP